MNRKALVLGLMGLVFFLAVEALLLRSYTRTDTRPPSWDQSIHMEIALDYREALAAGKPADAWYLAPKPGMPPFPPVYHLLLSRAYASADPAHAALWINWFYLAVLCFSIFGIAWRFRQDETAVAAVVLFAASPAIQDLLTTQLVDLPLTAIAAAAYLALLASEGFSNWLPSLAFAALHALGMLHKWSFFSYMLPAYWIALTAYRQKKSAVVATVSILVSAALTAPWYMAHIALLPSRLVQASSDFAISAWSLAAWMTYYKQAADSIGPVAWVLGTIGLLTPAYARRREQGWVLLAWVVTSYIFWTIVPNRQLRFLLPGLVPIGVALCGTWPKPAIWFATALQVLAMFNFYAGWVGPMNLNLPYYSFQFFENHPPVKEDWKIEEILRKIESTRDQGAPITNVTLIANDSYFNAPTFHWTQRRLGLQHVRMRGVNKRLCEFSEFVLVKDPKVGPATVIAGLPEAANETRDPSSWFAKSYEEIARWPLPDGNNAILHRRRRGMKIPYHGRTFSIQYYDSGKVTITNLKAVFGPWDQAKSAYKSISVRIGELDIRGLIVKDTAFEMFGANLMPIRIADRDDAWDDARMLKLERLKIGLLSVGADEVKTFLSKRVPGLTVAELTLDKTVRISGSYKGRPVAAEAALRLLDAPRRLKIDILSARLGGISLPMSVFREIKELEIPLTPNPETPFIIDVPSLTVANGRLSIP